MREGKPSKFHAHLGVWIHCLGPNSPQPGDRLKIVIYDGEDNIVRRFEQVKGAMLDGGYVDFFGGPSNRPATYLRPLVDIAPDGTVTQLVSDCKSQNLMLAILNDWAEQYGISSQKR